MTTGLDVVHVRAGYGAVEALHDVTLCFPMGSVVVLLGHNGAGKSSLLAVVAGTLAARSGHVTWQGHDVTHLETHERTRRGITVVPDDPNVFADMSVDDNLALFGRGAPHDAVYAAFPALAGKGDHKASTLSGGERQMVALGRLLLQPGAALLVDEISRGLSASAVERVYGVLDDLATPDRTIVVVEQYHHDILRRADLIYVLARGEVAWAGESGELTAGSLPSAMAGDA